MQTTQTLYDRVGGEEGIARLVNEFYTKVLADPELAPFFSHSSADRIRRMQEKFMSAALGGPAPYAGRSLAEVHRGRGITRRHIQLFIDHLIETMEGLSISRDDANAIAARVNLYADEVTGDFAHENL